MFRITVDPTMLEMTHNSSYEYSNTTYKNETVSEVHISPSYTFQRRMENMEQSLRLLMDERNEMKSFIENHPAVKNAYEQFLVVKELAKGEDNSGSEGCG